MSDYFSQDLCPPGPHGCPGKLWVYFLSLPLLTLFCAQLELHETQTLGWRNSLTRETSLLQPHASFHFPWEEGLPWLTGVGGSVPSGVEVRCPVCLEAPLVSRR